ncbi:hypothetical protein AWN76_014580 [Rhodothermaceae bacterium RA]|nr:hypothetical protein AWN76_014580 [Rhodothermaceae bacterium RA]
MTERKPHSLPHTLWSHRPQDRHFLIPDDAELPAGDFELRTVVGRQRFVDEAAVQPYEVTREEAKAWLKEQMAEVVDEAKDALLGFLRQARRPPAGTAPPAPQEAPSTDRIAARLRSLGDELRAVLENGFAEDDVQRRRARARLQSLGEEPHDRDEPLREGTRAFSDRLAALYEATRTPAPDPETRARHLEELADGIERLGQIYAHRLRDLAHKTRTEAAPPDADPPTPPAAS